MEEIRRSPVHTESTPLSTGFHTSQVVQNFQPSTGWGTFLSLYNCSVKKTISQLSVTKICTCTSLKSKRKTCLATSAVCLEKPWVLTNIDGGFYPYPYAP